MLLKRSAFFLIIFAPLISESRTQSLCRTVPTTFGTVKRERCQFPFIFQGKTFWRCTEMYDPNKRPWCSVETDADGNHVVGQGRWGHCEKSDQCGLRDKAELATLPKTSCRTKSGLRPNRPCVFPFTFRGVTHTKCTLVAADDGIAWCSVKVNSFGVHQRGQWGHCDCGSEEAGDVDSSVEQDNPKRSCPTTITTNNFPRSGIFLPSLAECGSSGTNSVNRFIVNGKDTQLKEFPFAVLINYSPPSSPRPLYLCGGSLINRRYVLTAAHCLSEDSGLRAREVVLGEHDIREDCDCAGTECAPRVQKIPVAERIVHESYFGRPGYFQNDIALLRLSRPANLNAAVKPVCLPLDEGAVSRELGVANLAGGLVGQSATVIGWGRLRFDDLGSLATTGASSNVLQKADMPFIFNGECAEFWSDQKLDGQTQVCASSKGGSDSCNGDSGGPMLKKTKAGNLVQLGLVSYGSVQCGDGSPAVLSRLTGFIGWIRSKLRP